MIEDYFHFTAMFLSLLLCACIIQIWHEASSGKIYRACEQEGLRCLNLAYEDNARDVMHVKRSNIHHVEWNLMKSDILSLMDDPIWKMWWKEWDESTPISKVRSNNVSIPLCVSDGPKKVLVDCPETDSSTAACIGAENGAIDVCSFHSPTKYLIPICREGIWNKIVTCKEYQHTTVCLPKMASKNSPLRPCTDWRRHLCLNEGLANRCLYFPNAVEDTVKIENWRKFWEEWNSTTDEIDVDPPQENHALCKSSGDTIMNCNSDSPKTVACVGAIKGELGACQEMNATELPVPVCIEPFSKEVVTCGNFSVAFLCFTTNDQFKPLRPCKSKNRRICLEGNGLLVKCTDKYSFSTYKTKTNEYVPTEDIYAKENHTNENVHRGLIQLCKDDSDYRIFSCSQTLSLSVACFYTSDGKIRPCPVGKNWEIGIPVCLQVNTSSLVTCEKLSHANLCFPGGMKKFPLSPCKIKSRFACLTKAGSIAKCIALEIHRSDGKNKEEEVSNEILQMQNKALLLQLKTATHLCKPGNGERLVECFKDPSISFACLSLINRKIRTCGYMNSHDLSIPVCIKGSRKYVTTCGKFSMVTLCLSEERKSPEYITCKSENDAACFINGEVRKCCTDNCQSKDKHSASIFIREAPKWRSGRTVRRMPLHSSDNISETVYKSIKSTMETSSRLCRPDENKDQLLPCEKDPTINLVCINVITGRLKSCDKVERNDLVMPICAEVSNKVVTCGILSKAPLCLSKKSNTVTLKACGSRRQQACLTKKGFLEFCRNELPSSTSKKIKKIGNNRAARQHIKDKSKVAMHDVKTGQPRDLNGAEESRKVIAADYAIRENNGTEEEIRVESEDDVQKESEVIAERHIVKREYNEGKKNKGKGKYTDTVEDYEVIILDEESQNILGDGDHDEVECDEAKCENFTVNIDVKIENLTEGGDEIELENNSKKESGPVIPSKGDVTGDCGDLFDCRDDYEYEKRSMNYEDELYHYDNMENNSEKKGGSIIPSKCEVIGDCVDGRVGYGSKQGSIVDVYDDNDADNSEKQGDSVISSEYEDTEDSVNEEEGYKYEKESKNDVHEKNIADNSKKAGGSVIPSEDDAAGDCGAGGDCRVGYQYEKGSKKVVEDNNMRDNLKKEGIFVIPSECEVSGDCVDEEDVNEYEKGSMDDVYDDNMADSLEEIKRKKSTKQHHGPIEIKVYSYLSDIRKKNTHMCILNGNKLKTCDKTPSANFACLGIETGDVKKCQDFESKDIIFHLCTKLNTEKLATCDIISNAELCLPSSGHDSDLVPCKRKNQKACVKKGAIEKCTDVRPIKASEESTDVGPGEATKEPTDAGLSEATEETTYVGTGEATEETTDVGPGEGTKEPTDVGQSEATEKPTDVGPGEATKDPTNVQPDTDTSEPLPQDITTPDTVAQEVTDEKFFRFHCTNCSIESRFIVEGTPDDVLPEIEVITFPPV